MVRRATLVLLLVVSTGPVASAAETRSVYTRIDFDQCTVLETDEVGASLACPGYRGFPLWLADSDLRFFVSYGFGAPEEMAARQTLPGFNHINTTLEWRLKQTGDTFKPFATILRFYLDRSEAGEPDGQVLVVTRIEPGNTCHIAYIDARAAPDGGLTPNERARQWADTLAPDFDCTTDEPHHYPG